MPPSVCPSLCPSVRLSVRPSVFLSIRPSVCPFFYPSVRSSVRPFNTPSVCGFVRLFFDHRLSFPCRELSGERTRGNDVCFSLPKVTNMNILLTISVHHAEIGLWELVKSPPKIRSVILFSQLICQGNVCRSVCIVDIGLLKRLTLWEVNRIPVTFFCR